ncbi:hypothetical protein QE418_000595 [Microbacterium testaceum]|uniref:hypothetical protein n=1 Tax=Microbacterium TaxID=33882 RepID=UPI00277F9145|nr:MULTISPECIES: hypothetical protein [Microbacterium]MDQ1111147.1 hypothetical protein [Microbacterium testaceum]MDR6098314.1 hypothetical protein [Microbacterium sp. SORGH_AS_0454]
MAGPILYTKAAADAAFVHDTAEGRALLVGSPEATSAFGPAAVAQSPEIAAQIGASELPRYSAQDNVIMVSRAGSDANDGRAPGSAKKTIQAAIDFLHTTFRKGKVIVGAGVFIGDLMMRDGISVVGMGSNSTTIQPASGSTAPAAVTFEGGPVNGILIEGIKILGNGNAGQMGIYAYARAGNGQQVGGWWYSTMRDVAVSGFTGRGIWLRGGGPSYLLPHQFLKWEMVRVFMTKAANKEALVISGQVGQIDFIQCQFDSDEKAPYGSVMTVPNVLITDELNDDGTSASAETPYSLTFHTPTLQGGWKAVLVARLASGIEFLNPHLEGFKYGMQADSNAVLTIRGGSFSNVGNGDGTGWWTRATNGGVVSSTNITGNIKDKTHTSDGNIGSVNDVRQGPKNAVGGETDGLTKQVSVDANGKVILKGNRTAFCSTSTTAIKSIESSATPGESIFIEAFGGSLTFSTGSGLMLGGENTLTIPEKAVAQFVRLDVLNVWALVGSTPRPGIPWVSVAAGDFQNSWSSVGEPYSPVAYRLSADGTEVLLVGALTGGTSPGVAFTLPAGYRPAKGKRLSAYSVGNGGGRGIEVGSDGTVRVLSGVTSPISLDGLRFPINI